MKRFHIVYSMHSPIASNRYEDIAMAREEALRLTREGQPVYILTAVEVTDPDTWTVLSVSD